MTKEGVMTKVIASLADHAAVANSSWPLYLARQQSLHQTCC